MDYKIAIPSLGRSDTIMEQTLTTLMRNNIKPTRITVFVVKEEYEEYRKVLPENIAVVIGERGIIEQRKFIHHYYDEGTCVVSIDDDISDIDISLGNCQDLNSFIMCAFDDLYENDAYLWGVYPVWNQFFRKQREQMLTGLTFIIGCFYGVRIRHDEDLETTISMGEKEDTERTLRHYIKDGCVIRYNRIGIKTKFFSPKGGIGNYKKRKQEVNADALRIAEAFNIYGKIVERKNGKKEFKFESIARRMKTDVVTRLDRLDPTEFDNLYARLMKIKIPQIQARTKKYGTSRRGFPTHRAVCLGMVKRRVGKQVCQSVFSVKHPEIHEEVFRIGKKICPFDFTSVHLNHNVPCPPHVDSKNAGVSCIVSFGEYEGGKLIVNGEECDAWCQPYTFNGSVLPHWNTPLEEGSNKYSLVFYNNTTCVVDDE